MKIYDFYRHLPPECFAPTVEFVGWVERSGTQHQELGSVSQSANLEKNGEGIDISYHLFVGH